MTLLTLLLLSGTNTGQKGGEAHQALKLTNTTETGAGRCGLRVLGPQRGGRGGC